jgi:hypothetical protein
MLLFGLLTELLVTLGGLGFVCLVTGLFVVIARFVSKRVLDENDGSSLN